MATHYMYLIVRLSFTIMISTAALLPWNASTVSIPELNRTNAFVAYHNNTMYLLGGVDWYGHNSQNGPYDIIEFPLDTRAITSYNISFDFGQQYAQSSIQMDSKLWMLPKGSVVSANNPMLNVFDLNTQTISEEVPFPGNSEHERCVTNYNQYVFVLGGYYYGSISGRTYHKEFQIYDTILKEWSQGTDLPKPTSSHSCNVVGDTLYVIGGEGISNLEPQTPSDMVQYLNINPDDPCCSMSWQTMEKRLSSPRKRHRSVFFGRNIYVIGGQTDLTSGYLDQVDTIDTTSKTIHSPIANKLTYAQSDLAVIIAQQIIYCFGGTPATSVLQYAPIAPSENPTNAPTSSPTTPPSNAPSNSPTMPPSKSPSFSPSDAPTTPPSNSPSDAPSFSPTRFPTASNEYNKTFKMFFQIHHFVAPITSNEDIQRHIIPLIETTFVNFALSTEHLEYRQFEFIVLSYDYEGQTLTIRSSVHYYDDDVKRDITSISY
eukprot:740111_1